ncbi:hypothetical protein PPSIR1_36497 [Plesiocystis pacifica SIR-1]|uniref:Uncharacterized protein n=1 Tax=Plesiocystis pacifica SIR-1 TaxID=391625 RepID=A6G1K4_9BACT|nr:hypothetical protein [Plesiocystis pacifica]EDM80268.1 hypothetical protein PPSIR1_36497 [Plesiocystis pacifica SIR-1]
MTTRESHDRRLHWIDPFELPEFVRADEGAAGPAEDERGSTPAPKRREPSGPARTTYGRVSSK